MSAIRQAIARTIDAMESPNTSLEIAKMQHDRDVAHVNYCEKGLACAQSFEKHGLTMMGRVMANIGQRSVHHWETRLREALLAEKDSNEALKAALASAPVMDSEAEATRPEAVQQQEQRDCSVTH